MANEIEIPYGHEARIEGNKVVFVLKESEDERIRKEIVDFICWSLDRDNITDEQRERSDAWLAYLERQKEQIVIKQNIIDSIRANTQPDWDFSTIPNLHEEINRFFGEKFILPHTSDTIITVSDVIRCAYHFYKFGQQEQKPVESDAIKGGDFISDGKRVFLVLANVKERNLGETFSTFCEGLILGVDGVVYCNGDDFKKFKRATSDERAKFIHDLKVGVEVKEQPAEWSEEDKTMLERCISKMTNIIPVPGKNGLTNMSFEKHTDEKPASWLKSLPERFNLQSKQEWSEEDRDYYDVIIAKLEVTQDDAMLTDGQMSFLKSIPERFNVQPKRKWSEEDEVRVQQVINVLDKNGFNVLVNWMKDLPERFPAQPNRVWSKEDERAIDRACVALRAYSNGDIPEFLPSELLGYADRLQSILTKLKHEQEENVLYWESGHPEPYKSVLILRSGNVVVEGEWSEESRRWYQYGFQTYLTDNEVDGWMDKKSLVNFRHYWVPSQEQMDALLKLEESHVLEHEKTQETAHLYMVIKSLREELFKLMK